MFQKIECTWKYRALLLAPPYHRAQYGKARGSGVPLGVTHEHASAAQTLIESNGVARKKIVVTTDFPSERVNKRKTDG